MNSAEVTRKIRGTIRTEKVLVTVGQIVKTAWGTGEIKSIHSIGAGMVTMTVKTSNNGVVSVQTIR
jgi:hypothetical protein